MHGDAIKPPPLGVKRPLIRVSLFNADSENDFTLLEDNGEYFVSFGDRTGTYREFVQMLFDDDELAGFLTIPLLQLRLFRERE